MSISIDTLIITFKH